MELRHVRYFVAVAEECHFGRAAERLHIAQPPLSQQIKQLETELGVQLLARSTRKVELTPAGQAYLRRARRILATVDAAADEARHIASGNVGHLSVGFTGSATYGLLPALARTLRQELPGIAMTLKGEMLTPLQVDALLEGALDLGFLRPPVRSAEIDVRVLRREPLIAAVPSGHPAAGASSPVPLASLSREPFICYPSQHRSVVYDAVFDACRSAGFTPRSVIEVAETSTMVAFVAAGLGVALVPASVRPLQVEGATYLELAGAPAEVELAVATRSGELSPVVQQVLSHAQTLIGGGFPRA